MSLWFQKMERDVVKYIFRMNDILITSKYDSLTAWWWIVQFPDDS